MYWSTDTLISALETGVTFVQNLDLLSRRSRRIPVPTSNGASSHDLPFPLDNVTRTERRLTLRTLLPSMEVLGDLRG